LWLTHNHQHKIRKNQNGHIGMMQIHPCWYNPICLQYHLHACIFFMSSFQWNSSTCVIKGNRTHFYFFLALLDQMWSMWMSYKLGAGSSNSYSFTGLNVHSTSIYLGKHCKLSWNQTIHGELDDQYRPLVS
jgi:hypothetical protein